MQKIKPKAKPVKHIMASILIQNCTKAYQTETIDEALKPMIKDLKVRATLNRGLAALSVCSVWSGILPLQIAGLAGLGISYSCAYAQQQYQTKLANISKGAVFKDMKNEPLVTILSNLDNLEISIQSTLMAEDTNGAVDAVLTTLAQRGLQDDVKDKKYKDIATKASALQTQAIAIQERMMEQAKQIGVDEEMQRLIDAMYEFNRKNNPSGVMQNALKVMGAFK